jgi:hypothetical protein
MTAQRFAMGTVVGGVVMTVLGYVAYGVIFAGFFAANVGSATGVAREPFDFVALVIGQMAMAAALTLILGWSEVSDVAQSVKVGAIVGLLIFLGIDLTLYATTNVQNLAASLVDPILAAVIFACASAAIAVAVPAARRVAA